MLRHLNSKRYGYMVRGALCALLNLQADMQVVAQAENGVHALTALQQTTVDILLTDIEMPKMNGIELIELIELIEEAAKHYPAIKAVVATTFGRAGYIRRAIASGARAFLLKDYSSDNLADTLRQVMLGNRIIDPQLTIAALRERDPLNEKERKALGLASTGKRTAEIAEILFLSKGTVRNYLSEAIAKLNATNRIDAARIAHQKGWL